MIHIPLESDIFQRYFSLPVENIICKIASTLNKKRAKKDVQGVHVSRAFT